MCNVLRGLGATFGWVNTGCLVFKHSHCHRRDKERHHVIIKVFIIFMTKIRFSSFSQLKLVSDYCLGLWLLFQGFSVEWLLVCWWVFEFVGELFKWVTIVCCLPPLHVSHGATNPLLNTGLKVHSSAPFIRVFRPENENCDRWRIIFGRWRSCWQQNVIHCLLECSSQALHPVLTNEWWRCSSVSSVCLRGSRSSNEIPVAHFQTCNSATLWCSERKCWNFSSYFPLIQQKYLLPKIRDHYVKMRLFHPTLSHHLDTCLHICFS